MYILAPFMFESLCVIALILFGSIAMSLRSFNAVRSILWLVLSFFATSCVLILCGSEYMAMLLVIIYSGALAVLFLFVIMTIGKVQIRPPKIKLESFFFFAAFAGFSYLLIKILSEQEIAMTGTQITQFNLTDIANVLYSKHFVEFEVAGLILFASMISVIVLVLEKKSKFIRSQNTFNQISQTSANCVKVANVKIGSGTDLI